MLMKSCRIVNYYYALTGGWSLLKSIKKVLISFVIIVIMFVGVYLFSHSTPERLIRTDLFLNGHIIGAFTTDIYKAQIDS